ncbi:hypothetical protein, partial [Chromobacterium haemolyticum]|uniref:hypothetical protein n=1 Tax=Chromobacterium haemolyticum TaxID=394935 RepID=UPI00196436B6
ARARAQQELATVQLRGKRGRLFIVRGVSHGIALSCLRTCSRSAARCEALHGEYPFEMFMEHLAIPLSQWFFALPLPWREVFVQAQGGHNGQTVCLLSKR